MAIGRSSTGTYHRVVGAASNCNGRSFRGQKTTVDMIEKAPEDMFCKKCFSLNARDVTRKGNAKYIHQMDEARGY